jgi:hypothetical protein
MHRVNPELNLKINTLIKRLDPFHQWYREEDSNLHGVTPTST